MDLTIKDIPTQAMADILIGQAKIIIDNYHDNLAATPTKVASDKAKVDKDAFRTDNGLEKKFTV